MLQKTTLMVEDGAQPSFYHNSDFCCFRSSHSAIIFGLISQFVVHRKN